MSLLFIRVHRLADHQMFNEDCPKIDFIIQLIYEKYAANRGSYRSSVSEESSTETMSSSGNSHSKKNPEDRIDSFSD